MEDDAEAACGAILPARARGIVMFTNKRENRGLNAAPKRLLAAVAVLAIATLLLAAVPAAMQDSDAEGELTVTLKGDITATYDGGTAIEKNGTASVTKGTVITIMDGSAAEVPDGQTRALYKIVGDTRTALDTSGTKTYTATIDDKTEFELVTGYTVDVGAGLEVKKGAVILSGNGNVVAKDDTLTVNVASGVTDGKSYKLQEGESKNDLTKDYPYKMPGYNVKLNLIKCYEISYDGSDFEVKNAEGTSTVANGTAVESGTALTVNYIGKVPAGKEAQVVPGLTNGKYVVEGKDAKKGTITLGVEFVDKDFEGSNLNIGPGTVYQKDFYAMQMITITGETQIAKGELVVVKGKLVVPENAKLTVLEGATLQIDGVAEIRGDLEVVSEEDSDGNQHIGRFIVTGEARISGNLAINGEIKAGAVDGVEANPGKIIIATGSTAEIGEKGAVEGDFVVQDEANLSIAGEIRNTDGKTKFEVAGTLMVNSSIPSPGFAVELSSQGAVELEKVVLGERFEKGKFSEKAVTGTITVTDKGIEYYNKEDTEEVDAPAMIPGNKVVITGSNDVKKAAGATSVSEYTGNVDAGAEISRVSISVETTNTLIAAKDSDAGANKEYVNYHRHASVMNISGSIGVESEINYTGETSIDDPVSNEVGATIAVTGIANNRAFVKVGGDLTISERVKIDAANATIDAPVVIGGEEASLKLTGTTVVKSPMTVRLGGTLDVTGPMNVKASIDAKAIGTTPGNATFKYTAVGTSKINVSEDGSLTLNSRLDDSKINAAYYTTKEGNNTIYHYVTVDAGLATGAKEIEIYGNQTLTESAEIPADTKVTLKGGILTIGAEENSDVVLTVKQSSGSSFGLKATSGSSVVVNGTLDAERMENVDANLRNGKIVSDVYSATMVNNKVDKDGKAQWTNIYTALANAESGQTVQIQKDITAGKPVMIKEGVILDVNGNTITVANKQVMTVNGTLDLTDSAAEKPGVRLTKEVKEDDKVVSAAGSMNVNGYVEYSVEDVPVAMGDDPVDATILISGAYYTTTSKGVKTHVITTYEKGAQKAPEADEQTVEFEVAKGDSIVLGNLALKGTDKTVKIIVKGDANVRSITMDNAMISVLSGKKIEAVFSSESDSIAVKGQVGGTDLMVSTDKVGNAAVMTVAGDIIDYTTKDGKNADVKVDTSVGFNGNVYMLEALELTVDKVTVTGNIVVHGPKSPAAATTLTIANDMDVAGTVDIRNGSTMTVGKTLTVNGTITVTSGKLNAANATVTVSSGASINASAVDTAGASVASFEAEILYVSVNANDFIAKTTGADPASVKGEATIGAYVLASPDAVLPEKITKEDGDYIGTKFMVEGKDYLRSYTTPGNNSALKISAVTAKVVDKKFIGWYSDVLKKNSNDEANKNVTIGTTGWETVSASLNPYIYTIEVSTDGGINYITAGGKLLTSVPGKGDTYAISGLEKGTYQLAISAKTGYDVSKVKIYNEKNEVTSMAITVGGETSEKTYRFSMIGSEPAGSSDSSKDIVEAIDKNTEAVKGQSNGGTGLTDTLLIILVVLIAIMAVIVALRLMRS